MIFGSLKFWAAKPKAEPALTPAPAPPQEAVNITISGEKDVNAFEKILFAFLATAAKDAPIFVHSVHGMVVLNAGEDLVGNLLAVFAKPVAAPAPPAA